MPNSSHAIVDSLQLRLRNNLFIATDTHLFAIDLLTGGCWSLPIDVALETIHAIKKRSAANDTAIPSNPVFETKEEGDHRTKERS